VPDGGASGDFKGAALLINSFSRNQTSTGRQGHDANWFREALVKKGITPCIPSKKNQKQQIGYDNALYKQRHKVENMFGGLKDWRRIATRYERCAHTFFSAICIAAIIIWWI
jgi:transposase